MNAILLELSELVKKHHLFSGKDALRDTLVADMDALEHFLTRTIKESCRPHIVVGHFADIVPEDLLDLLVILRCHPLVLADRLRQRGWANEKILENVQAEILGDCTAHALERHPAQKVYEVDTTNRTDAQVASCIQDILEGHGSPFAVGAISWLRTLDASVLYQIMEQGKLPT